ncbi:MAG: hypothetical protein H8D78_06550 [Chloroflexi bacterium]|nr:hypothetical protein [Chloroflexota bacterium]
MLRRIVPLLMVVALLGLLTGCGSPPSAQAVLEEVASFDTFTLKLPRMYVQYVENGEGEGEPALFGLRASQIESWFNTDLSMVKIPAFYMDWVQNSNLQHVELVHNGKGIFAYVNGKATPYLAWDGESVGRAAEMVEVFYPSSGVIKRLLPILRHIGLDIVVQMPLGDGAAAIPYRDAKGSLMETTAAAEIADPAAEVNLEIAYDANGVPSVLGMSADMLQPMMGYTPGQLHPGYIAQLKQSGVGKIALQTRGDGLFLFVNDQPLPNVAWSKEHLNNAVDIYAAMNASSWVPNADFVNMIRELVQQFGNSDVLVVIHFL